MSMCGKVAHAVHAAEAGCDAVVAQGTEAGGHTGLIGGIALIPQIVDAVEIPVLAAGGLIDGRGLAAALSLGADGVWIGTRFIATPEARTVDGYKDTLLALHEDGTVISRAYTGKTCRVVRTGWTEEYERTPERLQPFPQQAVHAAAEGANHLGEGPEAEPGSVSLDREFMPAGQGVGAIEPWPLLWACLGVILTAKGHGQILARRDRSAALPAVPLH